MKITVEQLRRIVRNIISESSVDEMAYAGKLPTRRIDSKELQFDLEDNDDWYWSRDKEQKKIKSLERYYDTPLYAQRAKLLLKPLGIDVWIQPLIYVREPQSFGPRYRRMNTEEGIRWLEKYAGINPDDIRDKIGPNSGVIVSMSGEITNYTTNSVWGMLHAMFDNAPFQVEMFAGDAFRKLSGVVFGEDRNSIHANNKVVLDFKQHLPFKWAAHLVPNKLLPTAQDVIAELLVAAAFRPNGLKMLRPVDGKISEEKLSKIEAIANGARQRILKSLGKYLANHITLVSVTSGQVEV